jgi:hypothetical protein
MHDRGEIEALGPVCAVGGERGGSLEGRRGGAVAAAREGPSCCCLERRGDVFRWSGRRLRSVPCVARGVFAAHRVSERSVDETAFRGLARVIGDAQRERMAKHDPGVDDVEQLRVLGRGEGSGIDLHRCAGTFDQSEPPGRLSRGDDQRATGRFGQSPDPTLVGRLDGLRHRQRLRERLLAGPLPLGEGAGQLEQRKRIPGRRSVQLSHDPIRQSISTQQLGGLGTFQAEDDELLDPRRLEGPRVTVSRGEQHRNRVGFEPPREEDQCVRGRRVQPIGVVDQADQRLRLRRGSQQAEGAGTDEEAPVERRAESEGTAQRVGLTLRDLVQQAENRPKELVQPGECKLRFGLDAVGEQHPHTVCAFLGVAQEGALADPRLSTKDERPAGAVTRESEQSVDALPLSSAPH